VVESRIADYEKRLAELEAQCGIQLTKIEAFCPARRARALLTPSTSAGNLSEAAVPLARTLCLVRRRNHRPCRNWLMARLSHGENSELRGVGTFVAGSAAGGGSTFMVSGIRGSGIRLAKPWRGLRLQGRIALVLKLQKQMSQFGKGVEPDSALAKLLDDTLKRSRLLRANL